MLACLHALTRSHVLHVCAHAQAMSPFACFRVLTPLACVHLLTSFSTRPLPCHSTRDDDVVCLCAVVRMCSGNTAGDAVADKHEAVGDEEGDEGLRRRRKASDADEEHGDADKVIRAPAACRVGDAQCNHLRFVK